MQHGATGGEGAPTGIGVVSPKSLASSPSQQELDRVRRRLRSQRSPRDWPTRSASTTTPFPTSPLSTVAWSFEQVQRIPDASSLAAELFQKQFEAASVPVVLGGLLADWPALPRPCTCCQSGIDVGVGSVEFVDIPESASSSGSGVATVATDAGEWNGVVCVCTCQQRQWTPGNLVRRFGRQMFECGSDDEGGDVHIRLDTYVDHYATPAYRDRNPFVIFDATILDRQTVAPDAEVRFVAPTCSVCAARGGLFDAFCFGNEFCAGGAAACRQQSRQPLLFLDVDGVLNRTARATHIRLDEDLVARLGA